MKLNARELAAFVAKPDPGRAGLLIYGPDAERVALHRRDLCTAVAGPDALAEMRLTRLSAQDLRRDPAALSDALRSQGFFPGPRLVHVEEAGDGVAPAIARAAEDLAEGDAFLLVTAGALPQRSKLRKVFEADRRLAAAGVYPDPPGRAEIEAALTRAGLGGCPPEVQADLMVLGQALEPADFRQTLEKIALYAGGALDTLDREAVALLAPPAGPAEILDAVSLAADGDVRGLSTLLARLSGASAPVAICIQAGRHFRTLHAAACDPVGPESALSRARPPVFGPRRERMARQARSWGAARLERGIAMIMETDLALRSPRPMPGLALVERLLIRLAMQNRRG